MRIGVNESGKSGARKLSSGNAVCSRTMFFDEQFGSFVGTYQELSGWSGMRGGRVPASAFGCCGVSRGREGLIALAE